MIRIKLAMLIGGIVLAYFGIQEWRLASAAKAEPQTMTCSELEAKGPGDNAHVSLTKFFLCQQSFVYEAKKNNESHWNKVYVPAVPLDSPYMKTVAEMLEQNPKLQNLPPPPEIKVLVKSSHVSNHQELENLAMLGIQGPALNGLVTNKIESIGSEEKKILEQNYPGIDFTKCYLIDHDRKPVQTGALFGMIGGGALLTVIGGGWMLGGMRSQKA